MVGDPGEALNAQSPQADTEIMIVVASLISYFQAIVLGLLQGFAELLRRRAPGPDELVPDPDARISRRLGWREALGVGTAQALALIPGFSRSGATMGGGLLAGLSNEDAARFAFLLATPIIGAAAV